MSMSASSLCQMRYDELEIGNVIGKGCSSVVLQATHRPTGTPLALKVSWALTSSVILTPTAILRNLRLITHIAILGGARCQVINIFDKSKRHQMIREICTLYNASCPRCVHTRPRATPVSPPHVTRPHRIGRVLTVLAVLCPLAAA